MSEWRNTKAHQFYKMPDACEEGYDDEDDKDDAEEE